MRKYYILFFLVVVLCFTLFAEEELNTESWMYLGNYQRNPIYHTKPIEKFTEITWKFQTDNDEYIEGQPLVYNNLVIFNTRTTIYCLRIEDGSVVWKIEDFIPLNTYTINNGILYIMGIDGKTQNYQRYLFAIKIQKDGEILWKIKIMTSSISNPLIYNNIIYFGDVIGNFYAIDIINKTIKWQIKKEYEPGEENHGFGTPCIYNNRIYVNLESVGIYCFDINTGKDVFNRYYKYIGTAITINNNRAYFPVYAFNEKYALFRLLDLDTFKEIKQDEKKIKNSTIGDELSSMAIITKDRIYAISNGRDTYRRLYCINKTTFEIQWYKENCYSAPPILSGNHIYTVIKEEDGKNYLYSIDKYTGKVNDSILLENYRLMYNTLQIYKEYILVPSVDSIYAVK